MVMKSKAAPAKKMAAKKAPTKAKVATKAKGMAIEMDKEWEAEDDVRTLMRAEEIRADKGRMEKAKALAAKKAAAVSKLASSLK